MSYINTSGAVSLGATVTGTTQGGSPLYLNSAQLVAEDYVSLVYSDYRSNNSYPLGFGVGPVGPLTGYGPGTIGGYTNLKGVIHSEDPGPVYRGNIVAHVYPELLVQSHYRGPDIVLGCGPTSTYGFVAVNSVANEFNDGVGANAKDLIFGTSAAAFMRFGSCFNGSQYPTMSVSGGGGPPSAGFVGIRNPNPLASLHAGCGTRTPVTTSTMGYFTNFGDVSVAVSDNTNRVEAVLGTVSGVPFVGTATAQDFLLRLNSTNRGIFRQTGDVFFGNTTPGTYNPESNVLGLTGFPSAAISMAGNRSADGSVGQVAWYNDAAGAGTRVAAILVQRSGANNSSTMTMSTMNAGTLTPSVFIGTTQWVGVLNQNPQAALDVTGSVRFSGALQAGGNTGNSGQYLQSQGVGAVPVWTTSVGTPGGANTYVQFNASGTLAGSTNFTWNDAASVAGITGALVVVGSIATATTTKTANYTVTANDSIVIANAASRAFIVSLPSATNIDGRRYSVKKTDATANIVMVAPPVGVTLDGSTQQTLSSQNQSVDLVAVSGNYFLV